MSDHNCHPVLAFMRCSGSCRYAVRCKRMRLEFVETTPFYLCHDHQSQEPWLREVDLLDRRERDAETRLFGHA